LFDTVLKAVNFQTRFYSSAVWNSQNSNKALLPRGAFFYAVIVSEYLLS